jgi:hypothetical protein
MGLPYIQDIVGDKKETPVAPFAKAREKSVVAYVIKRYKNNELESVCLHYYDESGREIIKGYTCARDHESSFENILDKQGRRVEHRAKNSRGDEIVRSHRKWIKHVDTFKDGYIASRSYPKAKYLETYKFSTENACIYAECIDEEQEEMIQHWEQYDYFHRISKQHYIRFAKDNPADIREYESCTYFYEDYENKDSRLSHCVAMISCMGLCEFIREEYLDYDEHGYWRKMRRYMLIDDTEELDYIEIREIAYSKEDIPKLEDSFAEAEYYLNIDEYDVYSSFNGYPF